MRLPNKYVSLGVFATIVIALTSAANVFRTQRLNQTDSDVSPKQLTMVMMDQRRKQISFSGVT